MCAAAAFALAAGCGKPAGGDGEQSISISPKDTVSIPVDGGSAIVSLTSSDKWVVECEDDRLQFSINGIELVKGEKQNATSGAVQVEISAAKNEGNDYSAEVVFKISSLKKARLTVKQAGVAGPVQPIEDGDGTEAKPYSASQARTEALKLDSEKTSDKEYYVRGIIHKLATKHESGVAEYGNGSFYISNDGKAGDNDFYCYQVNYLGGAKFTSAGQVKVGDDVVICGMLTNYNGIPETVGRGVAYIYSLNGKTAGPVVVEEKTIDEAIVCAEGTKVSVVGRVIATSTSGFIINDGTQNNMYCPKRGTDVAVGDIVKVTGVIDDYGTCKRLGDAEKINAITVESSTAAVAPTPDQTATVLQPSALSSYNSNGSAAKVTIEGTLVKSGDYYNLNFDGDTKPGGSVYTDRDLASYLNKRVTVIGYYAGKTNSWFQVVEIAINEATGPHFSIDKTVINVAAKNALDSIKVMSNVDWTVSAGSADVTVTPASGSGDGKIEISVAENTTYEPREYTVTVSTTADVATKSFTVTIKQAAADDPSAEYVELTNAEISAYFKSASKNGYNDFSITSVSGVWTGQSNHAGTQTFLQIRNKGKSCVKSPVFEKNVKKVVLTLTANKNINQERIFAAIPVDAAFPDDANALYVSDTFPTKYGTVVNSGTATATATGEATIEFTEDTKSFALVVYRSTSASAAAYFDSIKVYLK